MQAFRVWGTWKDDPEMDHIMSPAFELRHRAEAAAKQLNTEHLQRVGSVATRCVYVVREETVPRDFIFQDKPDRVVKVVLGDDVEPTDVSSRG